MLSSKLRSSSNSSFEDTENDVRNVFKSKHIYAKKQSNFIKNKKSEFVIFSIFGIWIMDKNKIPEKNFQFKRIDYDLGSKQQCNPHDGLVKCLENSSLPVTKEELSVDPDSCHEYEFYCEKDILDVLPGDYLIENFDSEILPYIRNIFKQNYGVYNLLHHQTSVISGAAFDRVDCHCNNPCEVPTSPSVLDATLEKYAFDDGEVFSSGDEVDKLESDTDSQDTVIEGEAYKRIRNVAIKEKILLANEELFNSTHNFDKVSGNKKLNNSDKLQYPNSEKIKNLLPEASFECELDDNASKINIFSDLEKSKSPMLLFEKNFLAFKESSLLEYCSSVSKNSSIGKDSVSVRKPVLSSYDSITESTCSSESSENGSDVEEVIFSDTSTSSDEATYVVPASGFKFYRHSIPYRLHTIAEENNEDSDHCSKNVPFNKIHSKSKCLNKSSLSFKNSKDDHQSSGQHGLKSNLATQFKNEPVSKILASSQIEKYFKNAAQENKRRVYSEDEMTDESGGVSSDEEKTSYTAKNLKLPDKKVNRKCIQSASCKNDKFNHNKLENDYSNIEDSQQLKCNTNFYAASNCESKSKECPEHGSDDEAKSIVNHLMQHISSNNSLKQENFLELEDMSPLLKLFESEIARLMYSVSPASLSAGEPSSSCSSTIGSNNSDYGSDTLESSENSVSDEEMETKGVGGQNPPTIDVSSHDITRNPTCAMAADFKSLSDPVVTEETLYICKQLMASLQKITDISEKKCVSDDIFPSTESHSAKQYITDQIVSLMQTVNSSHTNSPLFRSFSSNCSPTIQVDSDISQDPSDSDSPPNGEKRIHSKSKTPSESGSETTISASISIPSYDDSDRTPTESEISHEMDELYALLERSSTPQDIFIASKLSHDVDTHNFDKNVHFLNTNTPDESNTNFPFIKSCENDLSYSQVDCSLLHESASKLENLTPISIEERIARYKDAFLNTGDDLEEQEIKSTETRINVILPQPSIIDVSGYNRQISSSLPLDLNSVLKITSEGKFSSMKSCDSILSSVPKNEKALCNVTSVKIVSHNTYPPSSAIHKILSNNIDSTYLDKKHSYEVSICDSSKEKDKFMNVKDNPISSTENVNQDADHESTIFSSIPNIINTKEKASSENDLLVVNYQTKSKCKIFGTKSTGNICELESMNIKNTFQDNRYYSFKSSGDSFFSLDDSTASQTSTASLANHRSFTSTETIPEEEETCIKGAVTAKMSLSSSDIPDAVCDTSTSKSSTLPLSLRNKLCGISNVNHRTRSSFFSTSGVLRKLILLRDETGSSPHGRVRMRNRSLSGGSEDCKRKKTAVSECFENQLEKSVITGFEKDYCRFLDEEVDQPLTYQCRSQKSLSSFGGRSESVTSVYSAAGGGRYGTVIVTGDILFGLCYNHKAGALEINIKECRNLAPVDTKRNRSDPYVKVYLLPDRTKSGKRKTKIKKHTLNPVFDELLKFQVSVSELESRTLWLSVWHSDRFGRNDFLGEVMIALCNIFEISDLKWHPLQERLDAVDTSKSYKGDLILALKYTFTTVPCSKTSKTPVKGVLEVMVRQARNLMATRSNGTSDPFCKSYLLPDKSRGSKQKTPVFKKSCNPQWNHTFVYDDITLEELKERSLELTIWDYDKITSNDFLGGVRLGLGTGKYRGQDVEWMDSIGEERSLWCTMLEQSNTWVDGCLLLRSSMQSRKAV